MSMHKHPQSDALVEALREHRLKVDEPSQLADAFRAGFLAAEKHHQVRSVRKVRVALTDFERDYVLEETRKDQAEASLVGFVRPSPVQLVPLAQYRRAVSVIFERLTGIKSDLIEGDIEFEWVPSSGNSWLKAILKQ